MKSTFIIFTLFLLFTFSLATVIPHRITSKWIDRGTTFVKGKCYCSDKKCLPGEAPACQIIERPYKMVKCVCIKQRKNYLPNKK